MQDEDSLVRRAKENDQQAFARLYEEYFDRIYRYVAVRVGDRIEAEDLTQQVFVNALKAISSYRVKGAPFSAWLYRIAHNQVVDYLRKKKKRAAVPLNEDWVASKDRDPRQVVEQNLDIEQLLSATKRLTEAQREVISLRFAGELPIAQVAKIMGKSQGAIKALQHSAIVALRKVMLATENGKI
ncbi:MAG: sigma-70 family RNA polymerase sigma factor [Dehalococcoidales bacterium]|nr:MAG: sigma-70 family RNA polymerase sigma factor [Dehalococcoidales bacterium]